MARALNHKRLMGAPLVLVLLLGELGALRPLAPPVAHADDDAPQLAEPNEAERTAQPEAKSHYERGRDQFRAGRYGEAIVELKAALALDPGSSTLLYNVAYTSELFGKLGDAIDYYERYLQALPADAVKEREKTELTIKRLRGRQSEKAIEEPVSAPPVAKSEPAIGRADVWFWAALGGGAALLAGGAVTGMLALKREDDAAGFVVGKDGSLARHNALVDQANTFALASDLLIAAGGVSVVGATLLFFLRDPEAERAPEAAVLAGRVQANLLTDGKSAVLMVHGAF
jgi:tetratricopeptide (TPR) repeat protein